MSYRVLYLLQNKQLVFFEIKRLHVPEAAPASARYQWFQYELATNQLTPLDFVAMHSAPPFEEREFRQGTLRFSNIEGVYCAAAATESLILQRDFLLSLPPALAEQLTQVA